MERPTVLRRQDHDPGELWPPLHRDGVIESRSQERQQSRIQWVWWCALAAVQPGELDENIERKRTSHSDDDIRLARILMTIEAHQPTLRGDPMTNRMPWARYLGKGRRAATDGDSWSSAIIAATNYQPKDLILHPSLWPEATWKTRAVDLLPQEVSDLMDRINSTNPGDMDWVREFCREECVSTLNNETAWMWQNTHDKSYTPVDHIPANVRGMSLV